MGRKKAEKKDVPATETEIKFVRLELPIETHRSLRMEAARQEVSMARLARIAVEEYLERRKGARK
jgi:predicted HicB family RNase H-like nuclease